MSHLSSFPTEEPKTTKQKILEAGANLLQSKEPIKSFKQHLMSLSHIAGDPSKQYILHHFVNAFNEDFAQALLYDGGLVDSKLVGIQYIISDKVYLTLPEEEKKLWNPLNYMVKNGLLVAPSLPGMAEKPLMTRLLSSYSKTFLFWETGLNPLPLGIPQILSSFTADGQANKTLSTNLLEAAEIKLAELVKRRENIDANPTLLGGVNHAPQEVYQLFLQRVGGPQNQNQIGGMGSNFQTGMTGGYGNTPMTGMTGATGLPGATGMTGGYGNTPMTGLTGATGTHGTGALAGTVGALAGAAGLTGAHHQHPITGTTPGMTGMTGVNNPHQSTLGSVAAGVLGGPGQTKTDVMGNLTGTNPNSYHNTPTTTDYTAQ